MMTNYVTYAERLKYILYLVEKEQTGTPQELANRLIVSKSTVLRMIRVLKIKGNKIVYDRNRMSYRLIS